MSARIPELCTLLPEEKYASEHPGWFLPTPYPVDRKMSGWKYVEWLIAPWASLGTQFLWTVACLLVFCGWLFPRVLLGVFCLIFCYHVTTMGPWSLTRLWSRLLLRVSPARRRRLTDPSFVVGIVGAGHAGIAAAVRLRERGFNVIIFDKHKNFGGTWLENRYPGSRCDIPAALYCYSFAWPLVTPFKWACQSRLLQHAIDVADYYGLRPLVQFNTEVLEARWDEAKSVWMVKTRRHGVQSTAQCNVLISAVGQLSMPSVPKCLDQFVGQNKFHSSQWPLTGGGGGDGPVDPLHCVRNKRVAVVGAAASAIQICPEIAPVCKSLTIFQRSPSYIIRKGDFVWPRAVQCLFRTIPFFFSLYRWLLYVNLELLWLMLKDKHSDGSRRLTELLQLETKKNVEQARKTSTNPNFPSNKVLIPTCIGGCKRTLVSDTWFSTLGLPHVQLIAEPIVKTTENALIDASGQSTPVDVLICATGFRTTEFLCSLPVFGTGGASLQQTAWSPSARAYLGVSVPRFPSFFLMYGPGTNLGHNSILLMIESQADYIAQAVEYAYTHDQCSLTVKQSVFDAYNRQVDEGMEKSVFSGDCSSWYKTGDGRLPTNSPFSTVYYKWKLFWFNINDYKVNLK